MQLYKKKILILGKCLDGGTGSFLNLLYAGTKDKYNVHTCVLEKPSYTSQTFPISFFNNPRSYPNHYSLSLGNIFLIVKEIAWLHTHVVNQNIDICLGIDFHSSLVIELYHLLFWRKKIKTILTFHNNLTGVFADKAAPSLRRILSFFGRLLFSRSDVIITISKGLSTDIQHLFGLEKTPRIIYYGLPSLPKTKPKNFPTNCINIVSIARLDRQKDQITLINAFASLLNKFENKNVTLTLIGDGEVRSSIEQHIKSLSLSKYVKLLGWKKNPKTYLQKSDIFVLPSHREGFGLVLVEAMQHGIPVISSDVDFGPREILDNGKYGILVPIENEKAMTDAMYKLITNKKLYDYYAQKALERAKYFTLDKMINEYTKIIDSI